MIIDDDDDDGHTYTDGKMNEWTGLIIVCVARSKLKWNEMEKNKYIGNTNDWLKWKKIFFSFPWKLLTAIDDEHLFFQLWSINVFIVMWTCFSLSLSFSVSL